MIHASTRFARGVRVARSHKLRRCDTDTCSRYMLHVIHVPHPHVEEEKFPTLQRVDCTFPNSVSHFGPQTDRLGEVVKKARDSGFNTEKRSGFKPEIVLIVINCGFKMG